MNKKPAVFLDRDGVINVDKAYVYRTEDFEWTDGVVKAIRHFNDNGYLVIVVTNQSGVARGYYTEADVKALHSWMNNQLSLSNAHIDAFYHCPHHPESKLPIYRQTCNCRKPEAGMILQAMCDWNIDKTPSFLIGDKESDLQAATAAGIPGYLFPGGDLFDFLKQIGKI